MGGSRVLLTGATGFIGRHCVLPLVAGGNEVIATFRTSVPAAVPGVTWIEADLLQPGVPESLMRAVRPDLLVHLAWYVEPGKMMDDEVNLRWLAASLDVLRQFRANGGRRCVVSGSCYEYDWRFGYCSEDLTPTRPDTLYGAAKNSLAETMLAYCRAVGLSGAWARLFFLYGPHENQRRLVPAVILALLRGEEAKSSHGRQVRDYMHVQDAADGIVALLNSDAQGQFNIASGDGVPIRAIVERIGSIVGRTDLLRIGALPARPNDVPMVVGDPEKTRRQIGWQAGVDLESGLEMTVEWWRRQVVEGRT